MKPLVERTVPGLLGVYGVGYEVAAKLLVAAGDNPERLTSERAFAHMCGVTPLQASRPNGIVSTAAGTAKPTTRSTGSLWSG